MAVGLVLGAGGIIGRAYTIGTLAALAEKGLIPRETVAKAIADMKPDHIANRTMFKENLRIHLKRFVQKELSSKPVIVTTVIEV